MECDEYMRKLTGLPHGSGRCLFASVHGKEDGECWGRDPKNVPEVSSYEAKQILNAFKDPTSLFSSGIILRGTRFVFMKVEGDAILGRLQDQACLIMKTPKALIVCTYPGNEPSLKVYNSCLQVRDCLAGKCA